MYGLANVESGKRQREDNDGEKDTSVTPTDGHAREHEHDDGAGGNDSGLLDVHPEDAL